MKNTACRIKTMGKAYIHYIKKSISLPYQPFKMWIEATNHCNLACSMCPNSQKPEGYDQGFMDIGLYREIIRQIKGKVAHINLHHRGESLLHKSLPEMILIARNAGIKTSIHTNATLLTKELSKEIIVSGLDFLSFSFDGYDKESYESRRINAVFEKTTDNIRNFLSLKRNLNVKSPFTVLEFIDFGYTKEEIQAVIDFSKTLDCRELDQILIKKEHNWAGSHDMDSSGTEASYSVCTFPYYALVIFFNGTVVPCPQDFFGDLDMGNVRDTCLSDIWNNEKMKSLRENFRNKTINNISPCSRCDLIHQKTILKIPKSNISGFLKENLLGFSRISGNKKIKFK